jgi:hypothetical protein
MINPNQNLDGPSDVPPIQGVPFIPLNPEQVNALAVTIAHISERLREVSLQISSNVIPTSFPPLSAAPGVSFTASGPLNPGDADFPFDDNFDPNDFDGMMRKLQQMIQWMRSHAGNINALPVFLQFMINMGNQYGKLSPAHQTQLNTILGDFLKGGSDSFGRVLIMALVQFKFYQTGGDKEATKKYLDDLIAMLSPIASQNPWLQDLLGGAMTMKGDLDYWISLNFKDGHLLHSLADFLTILRGTLGSFMQKTDTTSWINSYYSDLISRIMKMNNPELIFYMLMALLIDRSDDKISDMGGLAEIIKRMRDMGADVSELTAWFKGNFTPDRAKAFVERLHSLRLQFENDPAFDPATKAAALAQIDSILNTPVGTETGMSTVEQLYQKCAASGKFDELALHLNALNQPTNPSFQVIIGALSSCGSTVTNLSLVTSQQVQQAQADLEQFLAFIKSGYDMFKMVETINRNMGAAG